MAITNYRHPSGTVIPWDDSEGDPTEQDLDAAYAMIQGQSGQSQPTPQAPRQDMFMTGASISGPTYKSESGMLREGQIESELATKKEMEKKIAESKVKSLDFSKELESFLAVDEAIPRGEGYGRFVEGLKSIGSAIGQEDLRGVATAGHDAAKKKLRVTIARLKDVGNLSETEQKAAESIIPNIFDSEQLTQLKRAYLRQIAQGVAGDDMNMVKQTLSSIAGTNSEGILTADVRNKAKEILAKRRGQ